MARSRRSDAESAAAPAEGVAADPAPDAAPDAESSPSAPARRRRAATAAADAAAAAEPAEATEPAAAPAKAARAKAGTSRSRSAKAAKTEPAKTEPAKAGRAESATTTKAAKTEAAKTEPPKEAPAATDAPAEPVRRRTPRRTRPTTPPAQRVAVVIPCKDESRRIAATVRAARAIPHVDLVLVVDDGSEDATQHVAREAGAVVVRHSHNRGKAAAMETGAAVVAMRDVEDGPARLLLFLDGDLGESAVNAAPLVPPVLAGEADATIALLPPQPGAGGRGIVVGLARRSIQKLTGWTPTQPLSGMRCLTREAFEAATPLARGWGVETGMTIDLLTKGFRIREVPCDLRHRASGTDLRGQMHRAAQYRDVLLAVNARRARRLVSRARRPGRAED